MSAFAVLFCMFLGALFLLCFQRYDAKIRAEAQKAHEEATKAAIDKGVAEELERRARTKE